MYDFVLFSYLPNNEKEKVMWDTQQNQGQVLKNWLFKGIDTFQR